MSACLIPGSIAATTERLPMQRTAPSSSLTAGLLALALAGPASAQLGTSGPAVYRRGVLGADLEIEFNGPALGTGIWLLAATSGPSLLPCVASGLPNQLEPNIGTTFVFSGMAFDAAGQFIWSSSLPAIPALAGFELYAQSISLTPFAPCPVTGISNALRFSLIPPANSVLTIGSMVVPRRGHSFDELPNGTALLSGGENPDPSNPFPLSSLEIYDPLREQFELIGLTLPSARTRHTTAVLPNGRLLISGGVGAGGEVLDSALLFDPNGGGFQQLPPMSVARVHHRATVLEGGRVLITGGVAGGTGKTYDLSSEFGFPDTFPTSALAPDTLSQVAAELYDPQTQTWSTVPANLLPRVGHAATQLKNGTVLITGGLVFEASINRLEETPIVTVWDPNSNATSSLIVPELARAFHDQISTADGGAIVTGGGVVNYTVTTFELNSGGGLATAVFDAPSAGTLSVAQPTFGTPHDPAPLVSLLCVPPGSPNPRYYVITCPEPGKIPPSPLGGPSGSRQVYVLDTATLVWTPVVELVYERPGHTGLYFDTIERAVVTGSAWPPPIGTVGFDRTAEVFTLP